MVTKIKNSSISLPKTWKGARVFVRIRGNSATITKVPSSKNVFTASEIKSLRRLGKKITKSMLAEAIKVAHSR